MLASGARVGGGLGPVRIGGRTIEEINTGVQKPMRHGRSKTTMSTYPNLQINKKSLATAEWSARGVQQVVKFEPLARNLSMKERRAFQKNLLHFMPASSTVAQKARGSMFS